MHLFSSDTATICLQTHVCCTRNTFHAFCAESCMRTRIHAFVPTGSDLAKTQSATNHQICLWMRMLTLVQLDLHATLMRELRRNKPLQVVALVFLDKTKQMQLVTFLNLIKNAVTTYCISLLRAKKPFHTLCTITRGNTNAHVCSDRVLTLSKLNQQETIKFANLRVNTKAHFCTNRVLTRSKLDWTETQMFEPRRIRLLQVVLCLRVDKGTKLNVLHFLFYTKKTVAMRSIC